MGTLNGMAFIQTEEPWWRVSLAQCQGHTVAI